MRPVTRHFYAERPERSVSQLTVLDPMRLIGVRAQPAVPVGLVVLVVALEPDDLAVALEREDVRRDAVEEPAVVADDDGAAGEGLERLFERAQRVDVEVVRRLVEQEQVAAALQHLREVHAVALAAREIPHLLLLVGAAEVEGGRVGARVHLALADHDDVLPAVRDLFPDRLVARQRVARLVDVRQLHRLADLQLRPRPASPGRRSCGRASSCRRRSGR